MNKEGARAQSRLRTRRENNWNNKKFSLNAKSPTTTIQCQKQQKQQPVWQYQLTYDIRRKPSYQKMNRRKYGTEDVAGVLLLLPKFIFRQLLRK